VAEPIIHSEPNAVADRLADFRTDKHEIWEIVLAALQGRNGVNPNHADSAAGTYAYHEGVMMLGQVFRRKEWDRPREKGIYPVVNEDLGIKIIFQNVDTATQTNRKPKPISMRKRPAVERVLDEDQPYFFEDMDKEREERVRLAQASRACQVWFLCVSEDGYAELSRFTDLEGGQFKKEIERIFIITAEDWDGSPDMNRSPAPDRDDEMFEPEVSRKQESDV